MRQLTARPRRREHHRFFWAGLAVYAAAYLLLYPPTTAIVDEHAYLTQAYLFRSGHLSYDGSPVPVPHQCVDRRDQGGRVVSKYPPGTGLWLVPFTLPGWRWVFVSGLVLALTGTGLVAAVLRRLQPGSDPAWALLFLCYPTVTVFSRTVMSDLPATVAGLAGFYFLLRGGRWTMLAGTALGLSCLFRYTMVAMVPPFAAVALARKDMREQGAETRGGVPALGRLLLGLAPFGAMIIFYNVYAYGGAFSLPLSADDRFDLGFLPRNLVYYGANLLAWYPLMLLGPLAAGRANRLRLGLPAAAVVLLYGCFSYTHQTPNVAERITIGMRYLLPALPYFIIGYAAGAERIVHLVGLPRLVPRLALGLAVAAGVAAQCFHQRLLRVQAGCQAELYASLPSNATLVCDKEVSEMVNVAWGWRDCPYYGSLDPDTLPAGRPLYAAALEKPGRVHPVALALFDSLVGSYPGRTLVVYRDRPYRFRLYRLRWATEPAGAGRDAAPDQPRDDDRGE
ncbi:glycosyltransferase family 39 protein [candidate division WOR-3 bacterium]|nr:glycosyltransferase family 39 protein [candidate division WOR-3 bacterium]